MSAPIPIQRLKVSRDRQYEYAATPIKAMLPGTVNRGEKIRTLSGSAVPATGIEVVSASVLTGAPATAAANPAKMTTGYSVNPMPDRRWVRKAEPNPSAVAGGLVTR